MEQRKVYKKLLRRMIERKEADEMELIGIRKYIWRYKDYSVNAVNRQSQLIYEINYCQNKIEKYTRKIERIIG